MEPKNNKNNIERAILLSGRLLVLKNSAKA